MRSLSKLGVALCAAVLAAGGAQAALKKYQMKTILFSNSEETSPPAILREIPPPPFDVSFVDEADPGSPVLRKFLFRNDAAGTTEVPQLSGPGSFIFISSKSMAGPGPLGKPSSFTGTGETADGSTIAWGIVTGWTITGAAFCHSSPPVICSLAELEPDTTADSTFSSDFYDLGTWTFHGTGFTSIPFVHAYATTSFGNSGRWTRGRFIIDATVPALPLLGVVLVGGSVVVGALAFVRRRG